ncbi:hypothetical protein [Oceanospirillum sediminis]|uniref:Uncharacterized protein n=1 Tax=Oceanospirillum sediminis TaxID=2760088 RepID=A0A839IPQ5_9GAMM|nr:hypothetical protein [Oceanospirillum sediminis]MBB1487483.1 hypothetical protein [Oceanospirillum sediminis]
MNARTQPEKLNISVESVVLKSASRKEPESAPVLKHMEQLKCQLQEQLDSLNTVVDSMQRISSIMERMADNRYKLNTGAKDSAVGEPEGRSVRGKFGNQSGHHPPGKR